MLYGHGKMIVMSAPPPFVDVISQKILPTISRTGFDRFIVAWSSLAEMKVRADVQLQPFKVHGPRVAVRTYTFSDLCAKWPNDHLLESRAPLLLFVLNGQSDLHVGDYLMSVPQGYFVLVPSGVPHWSGARPMTDYGDNPQRFSDNMLFMNHCGSMQVWMNHDRGNEHILAGLNEILALQDSHLLRLIDEIQDECAEQRYNQTEIIVDLLRLFFHRLQRGLIENRSFHPSRLASERNSLQQDYNPIEKACQFIRDNLHQHLTQDQVARHVHMGRTLFIRRFRAETGQTFNEFITNCRMEQAKILLQSSEFPLTFLAHSLGYKAPDYFNKLFLKHTGLLPAEYRRKSDQ